MLDGTRPAIATRACRKDRACTAAWRDVLNAQGNSERDDARAEELQGELLARYAGEAFIDIQL
jgi:hypothetical protein